MSIAFDAVVKNFWDNLSQRSQNSLSVVVILISHFCYPAVILSSLFCYPTVILNDHFCYPTVILKDYRSHYRFYEINIVQIT